MLNQIKMNFYFLGDIENAVGFTALHRITVISENFKKIILELFKLHNRDQILSFDEHFLKYYSVV